MNRQINTEQYEQLMLLRNNITASIAANNPDSTQRGMGMVQGYLLGLYAAQDIGFDDVQSLEDEVMRSVSFLMNARKVGLPS